jgi:hypothetical protein
LAKSDWEILSGILPVFTQSIVSQMDNGKSGTSSLELFGSGDDNTTPRSNVFLRTDNPEQLGVRGVKGEIYILIKKNELINEAGDTSIIGLSSCVAPSVSSSAEIGQFDIRGSLANLARINMSPGITIFSITTGPANALSAALPGNADGPQLDAFEVPGDIFNYMIISDDDPLDTEVILKWEFFASPSLPINDPIRKWNFGSRVFKLESGSVPSNPINNTSHVYSIDWDNVQTILGKNLIDVGITDEMIKSFDPGRRPWINFYASNQIYSGSDRFGFTIDDYLLDSVSDGYIWPETGSIETFNMDTAIANALTVGEIQFTFDVPSDNYTLSLPVAGTISSYEVVINWGDGSPVETQEGRRELFDPSEAIEHTYTNSGSYTVSITAAYNELRSEFINDPSTLISINTWDDDTKLDSINFNNCVNLISVPNTLPSTITTMLSAFAGCTSFNHPSVVSWDTSNVEEFNNAFAGATIFNQPIGSWNTSNVEIANAMFSGAIAFNQDISDWDFSNMTTLGSFISNSGMSTANYDAILLKLSGSAVLQPNVNFEAHGIKYSSGAPANARQYVIDTHGWQFIDDGEDI